MILWQLEHQQLTHWSSARVDSGDFTWRSEKHNAGDFYRQKLRRGMIYTTPSVAKSWNMLVAHDSRKQISYRLVKSTFRVSRALARELHTPMGRASLPSLALRFQPRPSVLFYGSRVLEKIRIVLQSIWISGIFWKENKFFFSPFLFYRHLGCYKTVAHYRLIEYRRCRYWKIYHFLPRIAVHCLKGSMCCCYFYTAAVRVKITLLWWNS